MAFIKDYTKRKVSISMAFILVVVFGFISVSELPVELFPPIEQPIFQVKVDYEVNNYKIVEQSISKRIERQLTSLDGVLFTESMSFPNYSLTTVYLDWQKDITGVLLQAREKLDAMNLPNGAERPLLVKNDPSRFPVFSYVIKGKPVETLSRLVENHLSRVFDQIEGIAEAQFIGTKERRVVIVPNDDKLKEAGVSYNELISQLNSLPGTQAGSIIRDGFREWSLRINDFIQKAEDINTIKLFKNGTRFIYLKDLCDVRYDYEHTNEFVLSGGEKGLLVHLIKESKANVINSAEHVYAEIEKIKKYYGDLEIIPVFDGAKVVQNSIMQLVSALVIGGILSFLVLIFFFKSLRIPMYLAIIIPVSTLGTFVGCWLFDVSFNLISLGGLGLGIGMLIDNGIIILEYVKQRWERGLHVAVHDSIKVLWLPMLTSTLTSLSVFVPLLTVGGMSSVLFKQQAITISLSLGWAYICSITLLPLLILTFPPDFSKKEKFKNKNWTLVGLRKGKFSYIAIAVLIIGLPLLVFNMKATLMPDGKTSKIIASYQVDALMNRDAVQEKAAAINSKLSEEGFQSVVYQTDEKEFSADRWLICEVEIDDFDEKENIEKIIKAELAGNWEVKFEKALLRQIVDERQDYQSLNINVATLNDKKKLAQLLFPYRDRVEVVGNKNQLFITLDLDREKLMSYRIPVNQFVNYLQTKLSGRSISEIKSFNRTDQVLFVDNFDNRLQLRSLLDSKMLFGGKYYPVGQFVDWKVAELPLWSLSINQIETVMLRKSTYDTDLEVVMSELRDMLQKNGFHFSADIVEYRISETNAQLGLSLVFSFILILFILAVQFESMKHPLLIVSIVPISFSGAFLALWALGESINVIALTGIVILMGIVINDTILKIDAIHRNRLAGKALLRSILAGSHSRLKAIILTTLSTVVASIPLLFGSDGIELRRPIAIVLIAGLVFSTYLTIQITPLLYYRFIKKES